VELFEGVENVEGTEAADAEIARFVGVFECAGFGGYLGVIGY
jgi:hypothetical protein